MRCSAYVCRVTQNISMACRVMEVAAGKWREALAASHQHILQGSPMEGSQDHLLRFTSSGLSIRTQPATSILPAQLFFSGLLHRARNFPPWP